ncbi:hypothetical protein PFISCL1PPCAC_15881, partial [Pristionchus fissidentatus]
MSEWLVRIDNKTTAYDYCSNDLCISIMFLLGFLIFIGLFFSGPENLVNNAIGFGLTTMMSMMVVVGILNDSLSKIDCIPCMGLFVLVQISITSTAVMSVLLTDKLLKSIGKCARSKSHDSSSRWRFIRDLTQNGNLLRNILFAIFTILHVANFIWFLSNNQV